MRHQHGCGVSNANVDAPDGFAATSPIPTDFSGLAGTFLGDGISAGAPFGSQRLVNRYELKL